GKIVRCRPTRAELDPRAHQFVPNLIYHGHLAASATAFPCATCRDAFTGVAIGYLCCFVKPVRPQRPTFEVVHFFKEVRCRRGDVDRLFQYKPAGQKKASDYQHRGGYRSEEHTSELQ